MSDTTTNFYPKGGRCSACSKRLADCSDLPFDQMPIHRRDGCDAVVICSDFEQATIPSSETPSPARVEDFTAWLVVAKYPHKETRRAVFLFEQNADDQGAEWCCDDGVVTITPLTRAALPAAGVPDGWKLVPMKPTDEMVIAFAEQWYSKRQVIDDPEMDDAYTALLQAAPPPPLPIHGSRVPAGLYRELGALRDLRDQLKSYSQRFLRDEMEDRDSCISADQHAMASGLAQALAEAFAKEWKGSAHADHGESPVSLDGER